MEVVTKKSKICFWDKHKFDNEPVYCPIFYKPKQIVKKKNDYYINQNVIKDHKNKEDEIIKEEIFYDCVFCSRSCCLAWIEDNFNNPKYQQSRYIFFNNFDYGNVFKSNHWETLIDFGGFLTLEQFRENKHHYELEDSYYDNGFLKKKYREVINYIC